MPMISPELLGGMMATLFAATAPAELETPEARTARQRSLSVAVAAFQPETMQEALLAMQILAAHWTAMARYSQANQAELGSVQASRLLRDALTAQRMQLAANRGLRLCRGADARNARRRQQEIHPSASAPAAALPPEPAEAAPQPAHRPTAPGAEAPLRAEQLASPPAASQPPAARPAQPKPAQPKPAQPKPAPVTAPLPAPLPGLPPHAAIQPVPPEIAARSAGSSSYKAALRSSVAALPAAA